MTTQRAPWRNPRHQEPSRIVGEPEAGYFRVQLQPRGPYFAARIMYAPAQDPITGEELDRSWYWRTEIDGDVIGEPSPDPVLAGVFRVWEYGSSISEQEYHKMIEQSKKDRNIGFKPMSQEV